MQVHGMTDSRQELPCLTSGLVERFVWVVHNLDHLRGDASSIYYVGWTVGRAFYQRRGMASEFGFRDVKFKMRVRYLRHNHEKSEV